MNQEFTIDDSSQFLIWHAKCFTSTTATTCRFDITSTGIHQVKSGDREFIGSMIAALGLPDSDVTGWTASRFYTPYYAMSPDAPTWEDRLSIAWRMEIKLNPIEEAFDYFGRSPITIDTIDDTWDQSDESSWEMRGENCILIADGRSGDIEDARAAFPGKELTVLEYADAVPIVQGRINLGILDFPEDESIVKSALLICREIGMATHYQETCFLDTRWFT
ncbi:hypothetical protein [Streptomyces sp. NPDC091416]|uniref:hypothetical protein n=1 Tax=Streptomyces sp. NPDC091416 TaxID=3366003 RepID=UPI0038138A37